MFHTILVAVDPSPARHSAIRMAADMARLTGAKVHVIHIAATMVAWDTAVPVEEQSEAEEVLREALATLREEGVAAQGDVISAVTGQIPAAILQAAREQQADLLVLSPHHRGAVAAFFNPRVSDAVAHASDLAVLLAPEGPVPSES
ncbi:universal stress protein [Streptomyces sp. NBC_00316]|uniref:universal stress protein n=1 Tax=Streptomyces sp. NBC_00316 TaxID=2975710 RepID=UPI002E2972CB|nr:universal stress protein [Streptomyces sp. NBC_00316]